jgi:hypothetical protein
MLTILEPYLYPQIVHGWAQNNRYARYTRKPGMHPPALDLHHLANTSAPDETPKTMATDVSPDNDSNLKLE